MSSYLLEKLHNSWNNKEDSEKPSKSLETNGNCHHARKGSEWITSRRTHLITLRSWESYCGRQTKKERNDDFPKINSKHRYLKWNHILTKSWEKEWGANKTLVWRWGWSSTHILENSRDVFTKIQNRNPFQNKRDPRKAEIDKIKITCYGCNKIGYFKNECP